MGLSSVGTLGCAAYCTWLGFWPVLPFAGLELGALGAALAVVLRRNRYREVVTFTATRVTVEVGFIGETAGRGAGVVVDLPRGWTRCWVEHSERRHAPTRLLLGSSGQKVEIGRCLTDEERDQLVARFGELLRSPVVTTTAAQADMGTGMDRGDA